MHARPHVWVLADGEHCPGVEHARGNGGRSVLVHVILADGLAYPRWVRSGDVMPRGHPDAEPD